MRLHTLGGTALALALATSVHAAPFLTNGSLEANIAPTMPDNVVYTSTTLNTTALPGWTVTSGSVDLVHKNRWAASDGNYSVDLIGTPGLGAISQTVNGLVAGTHYTLSFDFAINPENGWYIPEVNTTKRLQVQALAGQSVLATSVYTGTVGSRTAANMQYTAQAFEFIATGSSATLVLSSLAPLNMTGGLTSANAYCGPVIDNLVLFSSGGGEPVPEPASLSVLGLGIAGLLTRRARKTAA